MAAIIDNKCNLHYFLPLQYGTAYKVLSILKWKVLSWIPDSLIYSRCPHYQEHKSIRTKWTKAENICCCHQTKSRVVHSQNSIWYINTDYIIVLLNIVLTDFSHSIASWPGVGSFIPDVSSLSESGPGVTDLQMHEMYPVSEVLQMCVVQMLQGGVDQVIHCGVSCLVPAPF